MIFAFDSKKKLIASAILVYILIEVILFYPVIRHPFSSFIGGPGDAQQFMWYLGWFWHALLHGMNPLVSTYLNYPHGQNLMWNTSIIAESIMFGPFTYVFGVTFVFNALNLINIFAMGFFSFLIFDELSIRKWLAVAGGGLSILLPFTTAQLTGHTHVVITSSLFVIAYLLIRASRRGVKRPWLLGVLFGLLLFIQFYTSTEVLATSALVVGILFVLNLLFARERFFIILCSLPKPVYLGTLIVLAVTILPGLMVLFFGPYRPLSSLTHEPNVFVNDFLNFILPTPLYALHDHVLSTVTGNFSGNFSEDNGYIGVPVVLLIVWSTQRLWYKPAIRILSIALVIIAILSMGPYLHILGYTTKIPLPWLIIQRLPLLDGALPSRIMFYGDVFIVAILIFAFNDLLCSGMQKWRPSITVACMVVWYLFWLPMVPFAHTNNLNYERSIGLRGSVSQVLAGHPTMVLTDMFPNAMKALGDSQYSFPVANVYGFAFDSPAEVAYRPMRVSEIIDGKSQNDIYHYVEGMIESTQVQRIVYVNTNGQSISNDLYNTVTSICGNPIVKDGSSIVWSTRPLKTIWFSGDTWDVENIFDKSDWVGPNWALHSSNSKGVVSVTAPSSQYISSGLDISVDDGSGQQQLHLSPGQTTSIPFNDGTVSFHTNQYFIPQNILHNGDVRQLSMSIQVNEQS